MMHALENDINFIYNGTFSGVFTGGTLFKTFGHASLLVSRNEEGEIFMIQLVLPISDQFIVNESHNLVNIVENLPLRKAVDPMHMTHAMKVIESEGWSIEQEKEKENEYHVLVISHLLVRTSRSSCVVIRTRTLLHPSM
ncbi:hypothetical protein [Exiguobacterium artemiae]|uniref:hypothetical protein n=1 Tax=Exiguobacterium artemiae TaxID=340145 RepID=UPI002964FCF4|nr:hypothetical protein [Exiguobacterium sibiricum]MDW2886701.1 hypothetical protein [Exiguobacterium sibiricum]